MKKNITILILAVIWYVSVYSGSTGRITFKTKIKPDIPLNGNWMYLIDEDGERIAISTNSTIIIRRVENE